MSDWLSELLAIALLYLSGVILPGPNFVATVHRAVTRPLGEAMALVAGIASVNMLWAAAAVGGVVAIFAAAPWLFLSLKLAGAAYLIYLGVSLWRQAGRPQRAALPPGRGGLAATYRAGLLINLGNAKAILFFAGIFAAAMPSHPPTAFAIAVVALVGAIAFLWYAAVALLLSLGGAAKGYRRAKPWIDRASGLLIAGLGAKLAVDSLD